MSSSEQCALYYIGYHLIQLNKVHIAWQVAVDGLDGSSLCYLAVAVDGPHHPPSGADKEGECRLTVLVAWQWYGSGDVAWVVW